MTITDKIKKLKKERKAVILAHNYQIPEVQEVADFTGDSLGLSMEAAATEAEVIVFCGVYFMAETAKILSPQKKVIMPDKDSGCPMADMITAKQLIELKNKHPKAKVLAYVNTSAEVKAETDLCCTSANSVKIAQEAFRQDEEVIFVPDKFLAHFTAVQCNRSFIVWPGYCPTHAEIMPENIQRKKEAYPQAEIIVHPECRPEVIALADRVLSTSGMVEFAKKTKAKELIVGTEPGMIYRLKKEAPEKKFYPASEEASCPNMKKNTLEKVLWALEDLSFEVIIEDSIINRAQKSIRKMLEITRQPARQK